MKMIDKNQNHIISTNKRRKRFGQKQLSVSVRPLSLTLCALVFLASLLHLPDICSAQDNYSTINRGYDIKAAYLYNFSKYIDWPEEFQSENFNTRENFIIGLVESDPFGSTLQEIAERKTVNGKNIRIIYIDRIEDYTTCHILFIPKNASDEFTSAILDKTQNHSTLIIGEEDGFARNKGMINFIEVNNKIRFEINVNLAERRKLRISSKLLKVGKIIE